VGYQTLRIRRNPSCAIANEFMIYSPGRILLKILLALAIMPMTSSALAATTSITLLMENISQAEFAGVARVLARRFESLEPGFFDSTEAQVVANTVVIRFKGWTPNSRHVEYLIRTPGRFRFVLEGEQRPVFTDSDIADARPQPINDQARTELAIRLTDSAGDRVAALTQGATGKLAVVEWEGRVLYRIRISGPLARDIALSVPAAQDALLMSAALRGGRLPGALHLVQVK
jgi:hypothetical protein